MKEFAGGETRIKSSKQKSKLMGRRKFEVIFLCSQMLFITIALFFLAEKGANLDIFAARRFRFKYKA